MGAVESIPSSRPPLGLYKAGRSEQTACELAVGEALLLYTDGLYEVFNGAGTAWATSPGRIAATRQLLHRGRVAGAHHQYATAYADGTPFPDDIAAFSAVRG